MASPISPNAWRWQEDLKTLSNVLGRREDDYGEYGGLGALGNLDPTGSLQGRGFIGIPFVLRDAENPGPEEGDVDTFSFETQGGRIRFAVQGVGPGQNLEARLEVWSSLTQVGKSALYIETGSLNAALTLNLPAGTYYVKVMGGAGFKYGNLGQYTLNITSGFSAVDLASATVTGSYSSATQSALAAALNTSAGGDLAQQTTLAPVYYGETDLSQYAFLRGPGYDASAQATPVENSIPSDYVDAFSLAPVLEDTTTAPSGDTADSLHIRSYQSQEQGRIAIADKVHQYASSLTSLGDSRPTKDGYGRYQTFANGKAVIWSPDTGAHLVVGGILQTYINTGGLSWSYPTTDEMDLPGVARARFGEFYDPNTTGYATIIWTKDTGAHAMWGGIRDKWQQLKSDAAAVGGDIFGVPITGEYAVDGGRAQDFRLPTNEIDAYGRPSTDFGGPIVTISWSVQTGAQVVHQDVRDKWISMGRETWGFPTGGFYSGYSSNALGLVVSQDFTALRSPGSLGSIVRTNLGTYEVHGAIRARWSKQGALAWGIPISNELSFDGGKTRYNDFLTPDATKVFRIVWYQNTGATAIKSSTGGSTGTTSAPLTVDPNLLDLTAAYQSASDATWANWLSASTFNSGNTVQWLGSDTSWGADYASLFLEELEAIGGYALPFTPSSPDTSPYPSWWKSERLSS
ncbi:MAG TPA: hypothetical protein VGP44_01760, partial [Gemmatimonadales bacterium]|nr:hypothetical protein [Gemmatimonadales bacterium]